MQEIEVVWAQYFRKRALSLARIVLNGGNRFIGGPLRCEYEAVFRHKALCD